MMKRYLIYISILAMALTGITSCSDVEFFDSEDEIVSMTYTIGLGDDVQGRAIGDGNNVDSLYVGVYEEGKEVKRIEGNISNREAQITIELFKNRTYNLVFWAQSSQTDVYDLTDLRNISVTYPETMTLQEAARMDAFFLLKEVTVTEMGMNGGELTLKRPFAQLNIAASEEDALESIKRAVLTVQYENEDSLVLTYTDFTVEEGDKVTNNEVNYYYVATAFLKPGIISGNVVLYDDSEEIKSFDLNQGENLELKANHRYNVLGDMITQEELPGWDGITITAPEQEENRYIIDDEADLAWLSQKALTLSENATFVITKKTLNMGNKEIASIQLPAGSTFDGNGNTIRNYANSLFGDATNLTVKNLTLDHVVATVEEGHVGVLVNTLIGTSSFTEVTVTNSSATTSNGAAGGMIGYIRRIKETNAPDVRTESLEVTFKNCDLVGVSANGSLSEGKFVGFLSGYDNGETLSFDAECSTDENTAVTDYISYYKSENQSVWLDAVNTKYDGWLGTETYRRGIVMFEGKRLVPKWDGKTAVEPLLYNETNNQFEIYSPFDLAGVRKETPSPAAIYFKANIDMNGMGNDGRRATPLPMRDKSEVNDDNLFDAFNSVKTLDGGGFTLYNLSIEETHDGYSGAAFIKGASGDTEHKNLTIQNADIKNYHDPNFPLNTEGNAYAGTLVSTIEGNYQSSNITIKGGNVFAICKMGGLYGRIASGTATIADCKVDGTTISNYDSGFNDTFLDTNILGIPVVIDFHSDGEVGGLIGFITGNATITNCTVQNCHFYCTGENDWTLNVLLAAAKVPGRHVNQFIGDIRTDSGETITITNYSMSNNNMHTSETSLHGEKFRASDKYKEFKSWGAKTWDCVGFVYAVTIKFNDVPGTVKINDSTVMVSESMRK